MRTTFDNVSAVIETPKSGLCLLNLSDTPGQKELRHFMTWALTEIKDLDVVIICYAVDDKTSFKNAKDVYYKELQENNMVDDVYVMLVGCKNDIRQNDEEKDKLVDETKARDLASEISDAYFECSALTMDNIVELFTHAIDSVFEKRELKERDIK